MKTNSGTRARDCRFRVADQSSSHAERAPHESPRSSAQPIMLASVVCALGLHAGGLVLPSRPRPAATSRAAVRMASADSGAAFEAFEKARAMSVSEIKAELDLRGISYAGLFEKSELARALADSRSSGRANPEILDNFNRQKMEKMMDENAGVVDIDLDGDNEDAGSLEDATAGDGSLPGGMKPDQLAELMQSEAAC